MLEKMLTMKLLKEKYGVCRLNKTELIPKWVQNSDFFSITRTTDELLIVCPQDDIPSDVQYEREWRSLKVEGILDFYLIEILTSIRRILEQKGICIFVIYVYDTDYILVKNNDINNFVELLIKEGYKVME